MHQIKDFCWSMVNAFKDSKFNLSVASHMQYDEETQFNENNVITYLTELEEYMSLFITYMSHREKNPDAPISSLPLNMMENKDFQKDGNGAIMYDFPSAGEYFQVGDDTTAEEDLMTKEADIYRYFEGLVAKGNLQAIQAHRRWTDTLCWGIRAIYCVAPSQKCRCLSV